MIRLFSTNSQKGFSLVEMLVAISILFIATTPALFLASQGTSTMVYSKNAVTAKFLAEEGMEYMNNQRDSNLLKIGLGQSLAGGWIDRIHDRCSLTEFSTSCRVDPHSPGSIVACATNDADCDVLRIYNAPPDTNQETKYSHNQSPGWTVSIFRRNVTTVLVTPNEIEVTVTVRWMDKNQPKTFELKQNFFNLLGA